MKLTRIKAEKFNFEQLNESSRSRDSFFPFLFTFDSSILPFRNITRGLVPVTKQNLFKFQVQRHTGGHTYPDGTIYLGSWNEKGQKDGLGHLVLPDATRYVGSFRQGLCFGLGVMMFPDGARYEGEFMEGWFHGHGVFTRGDGMKYEGEFRGGRLWGWGLVTFRDSTHGFPRQEGFFQDCRLLRNKKCEEVIERAQKVALLARAQAEQF